MDFLFFQLAVYFFVIIEQRLNLFLAFVQFFFKRGRLAVCFSGIFLQVFNFDNQIRFFRLYQINFREILLLALG